MSNYEVEVIHRIYGPNGEMYEVTPDGDGLGLIEIRYYENMGNRKPTDTIMMDMDALTALTDVLKQITERHNVSDSV